MKNILLIFIFFLFFDGTFSRKILKVNNTDNCFDIDKTVSNYLILYEENIPIPHVSNINQTFQINFDNLDTDIKIFKGGNSYFKVINKNDSSIAINNIEYELSKFYFSPQNHCILDNKNIIGELVLIFRELDRKIGSLRKIPLSILLLKDEIAYEKLKHKFEFIEDLNSGSNINIENLIYFLQDEKNGFVLYNYKSENFCDYSYLSGIVSHSILPINQKQAEIAKEMINSLSNSKNKLSVLKASNKIIDYYKNNGIKVNNFNYNFDTFYSKELEKDRKNIQQFDKLYNIMYNSVINKN